MVSVGIGNVLNGVVTVTVTSESLVARSVPINGQLSFPQTADGNDASSSGGGQAGGGGSGGGTGGGGSGGDGSNGGSPHNPQTYYVAGTNDSNSNGIYTHNVPPVFSFTLDTVKMPDQTVLLHSSSNNDGGLAAGEYRVAHGGSGSDPTLLNYKLPTSALIPPPNGALTGHLSNPHGIIDNQKVYDVIQDNSQNWPNLPQNSVITDSLNNTYTYSQDTAIVNSWYFGNGNSLTVTRSTTTNVQPDFRIYVQPGTGGGGGGGEDGQGSSTPTSNFTYAFAPQGYPVMKMVTAPAGWTNATVLNLKDGSGNIQALTNKTSLGDVLAGQYNWTIDSGNTLWISLPNGHSADFTPWLSVDSDYVAPAMTLNLDIGQLTYYNSTLRGHGLANDGWNQDQYLITGVVMHTGSGDVNLPADTSSSAGGYSQAMNTFAQTTSHVYLWIQTNQTYTGITVTYQNLGQ